MAPHPCGVDVPVAPLQLGRSPGNCSPSRAAVGFCSAGGISVAAWITGLPQVMSAPDGRRCVWKNCTAPQPPLRNHSGCVPQGHRGVTGPGPLSVLTATLTGEQTEQGSAQLGRTLLA